ncbi:MAG: ClpXP protease specificity-enhancing factor [Glaciimonas sp.]|nr:ClpXP protease specificity-enhancing factor [Glaciimonas sp.]
MSETTASTKPYLLRAIYEWCTDNGFTPYLLAQADATTRVPQEFVKNGEIVLNVSFEATSGLKIDNSFVNFNARFSGVSREISVPIENVMAIYARENGQGMAFEVAKPPVFSQNSFSKGVDDDSPSDESVDKDGENRPPLNTVLTAVPSSRGREKSTENTAGSEDDPEPPKNNGKKPTLTRIK